MNGVSDGKTYAVFKIAASGTVLAFGVISVTIQYVSDVESIKTAQNISYSLMLGYVIGSILSEKFYLSFSKRKAAFISYFLCVGSCLGLYVHHYLNSVLVLVVGYTLSGIGQSLFYVLLVGYATPYIRAKEKSLLLSIVLGTMSTSGLIGTIFNYVMREVGIYSPTIYLIISFVILSLSIGISWNIKGFPHTYIKNNDSVPDVPFKYLYLFFYTYGVCFI